MPWPGTNAVDVLASECERLSDVVLSREEDFSLPTRCPAWDVKVPLGHLWLDVDRILVYRDAPAPSAPDTTSVTSWRSYDRVRDAPSIPARSLEVADAFESGLDLARSFHARWRGAVEAARAMEPDRVMVTLGPAPSDRDRAVLGELPAAFPLLG